MSKKIKLNTKNKITLAFVTLAIVSYLLSAYVQYISKQTKWLTFTDKEYGFQIDYPNYLGITKAELGYIFDTKNPDQIDKNYMNIQVVKNDEEHTNSYLAYLTQTSEFSSDLQKITSLPGSNEFYSNKTYSGIKNDNEAVYSVSLLVNNAMWDFHVMGIGEGSSYKENPNSLKVFNRMLSSFNTLPNTQNTSPNIEQALIKLRNNNYSHHETSDGRFIYIIPDLLQFTYPKDYSIGGGYLEVSVTDNKPGSMPQAGTTLNIFISKNSGTKWDTGFTMRDCITTQYIFGIKVNCPTYGPHNGRTYFYTTHKGKDIQINTPSDQYQDIIPTIKLL